MSMPLRHLPVLQNWDCHVCGQCCREYEIVVTDAERQRIEAQGWDDDPDIGDLPRFVRRHWWSNEYKLNVLEGRGCVFLTGDNRCRIHARFGHGAKPLGCRLFPYVMIPAGDHWRVGVRFACPSAAANLGRPIAKQSAELNQLAEECATRQLGARVLPPPVLQGRHVLDWADVMRLSKTLHAVMSNRADPVERRLRKWLKLAELCRQAKFDKLKGQKLAEFLDILTTAVDDEIPRQPQELARPGWIGRILFRLLIAVYGRKDHGLLRGIAGRGRLALLSASWRFARGRGLAPRINSRIGEVTFADLEKPACPLSPVDEATLERYYLVKLDSMQFFGPANFGQTFWDGLESLALTYPLIRWLARAMEPNSGTEAVSHALSIVDDHFAANPALKRTRFRLAQRLIASRGELARLIAWYGRSEP
jgi:lysine-N-methylase